jgi:hypothetical protein
MQYFSIQEKCLMYDIIWALFLTYLEAQDNADQYTNELDRLKSTLLRTEEEKKRLEDEVTQVRYLFLFSVYTVFAYIWDVYTNVIYYAYIVVIILIVGKGNVEEGSTEGWKWKQPERNNHYRI